MNRAKWLHLIKHRRERYYWLSMRKDARKFDRSLADPSLRICDGRWRYLLLAAIDDTWRRYGGTK